MADTSGAAVPATQRPTRNASGAAAAARSRPTRRPAKDRYSRPSYDEHLVIHSVHAQRLIQRGLLSVVRALYAIGVVLRILGDDDDMDEVDSLVDRLIAEFATEISEQIARLNKLAADHGVVKRPIRYSNPRRMTIQISSPHLARYVEQIKRLDEMECLIDQLWMGDVLNNKQRTRSGFEWRVRMQKIASQIIAIEKRARAAIVRRGMQEEMDAEDARSGGAPQIVGLEEDEAQGAGPGGGADASED
jgi:hypothetical protein